MNIWILNHYATPPDTPGITRHYDIARELINKGCNVTIFAAGFNHRTRREERLTEKQLSRLETIVRVKFMWIRTTGYYGGNDWHRVVNMFSYMLRVIPVASKYREKPDVIMSSSPHPFTGLAGLFLAGLKKTVFIFEVRDLWPQTLVDIGGYSDKSLIVKMLRVLEKLLYRKSDKIIVLHPGAVEYITRLGIPSDKVVHIPNGFSPEMFASKNTTLPQELKETIVNLKLQNKVIALYAGAHGIANSLNTIVRAARLLQEQGNNDIHFLFVGDGPEKKRLIQLSNELGLHNTSFFSSIPKQDMPELIKSCDIALLSYLKSDLYAQYGMSTNKLWDYMACARPVVWAIQSANDPVQSCNCGITVPPEDPVTMANAVLELSTINPLERDNMGKRGCEYVLKYHSIPVLADMLINTISELIPKTKCPDTK